MEPQQHQETKVAERKPHAWAPSAGYLGLSACSSYLVSFIVHLLLIIGLAIGVVHGVSSDVVLLSLSTSGQVDSDDQDIDADFSIDSSPAIELEESPASVQSTLTSVTDMELVLPEVEQSLASSASGGVSTALGMADSVQGGKKNGKSLAGSGSSFFGIESSGEKFVFVVDSSRSMEGKRWMQANKELMRSVTALGPTQKFYVICFDQVARPAFDLHPSEVNFLASSNNSRRRLKQWIQNLTLGSNTRPAEALRMALALKPDAIYLLSDGELEDESYQMLATANHDPKTGQTIVPIHTISLFSTAGKELLELIASNNGGKFVHVVR
jgi:hypothetical protein